MRSQLEIIRDIVRLCQRGKNITSSRIMGMCNLSFAQLHKHIRLCEYSGFIERYSDRANSRNVKLTCYRSTAKGIEFAEMIDNALLMVDYNDSE